LDHLQVGPRRQGKKILLLDEGGSLGQHFLGRRNVIFAGGVTARGGIQSLLDGLRRGQLRHFVADSFQVVFRGGEQLLGGAAGGQHQGQRLTVPFLAESPIGSLGRK